MNRDTFSFLLLFSSLATITTSQNIYANKIHDISNEIPGSTREEIEGINPFEDVAASAASFLQENAGDMISNFIQADGGKAMENLLMGAAQNPDTTNQILSGLGSIFNQKNSGAALDPAIIGNMLSLMANNAGDKNSGQDNLANVMGLMTNMMSQQSKNKDDSFDIGTIANSVANMFTDSGENPVSLLMSSFSSFLGPDAERRKHEHASHAYLLPPFIEKAHLYFDHFRHTELYKALWKVTGAEKLFNTFTVNGKFNLDKFLERLENKSFRKHWISIVTRKISDALAFVTDSSRYKKYVSTAISLFNSFLKSLDFPKSTLFDITRSTETLTNLANYFLQKYLSVNMDARQYVVSTVKYAEDILDMAHNKGYLVKNGLNSHQLAQKLTDTLNLEIIEPILRVGRAFRFIRKVPECDKYVMCLINQEDQDEKLSLPGLKTALSKTGSMFASWFLSEKTGTSFWTLYSTINDEKDCSIRFLQKCNDFHVEEIKVDKEYTHTEL